MNQKEEPNFYRTLSMIAVIFATAVLTAILSIRGKFYTDEWICMVFLDLVFLSVFVFEMEYERGCGLISENRQTSFARVSMAYDFCAAFTAGMAFLPDVFRPVLVIPILFCAVSTPLMAVTVGLYFDILLGIVSGSGVYGLAGLCLLTLLGAVLGSALQEKKFRLWITALLFMFCVIVPAVFYELANKQMQLWVYAGGAASGILTAFCSWFVFPALWKSGKEEVQNRLFDIVSEDFSEVKALKKFSVREYQHAVLVADIAYRCGKKMKYDAGLCLAAGFYYRLGFWVGEPYIENGVSRGKQLCFPQNVINVLEEYYGKEKLPSTQESALVHMVDVLVTKLETGGPESGKQEADREFLVYHTLNELSGTGIYDNSGMSMNQFLQVRDLLAKEEKLR